MFKPNLTQDVTTRYYSNNTRSVTRFLEANWFRYDYQYYGDSQVWLKHHKVRRSWHDARNICSMEGATLALPDDENFTNAIVTFASNNNLKSVYTGVHATFSRGVCQSMEGIPLERFQNNFVMSDLGRSEHQCAVLQAEGMVGVKCLEQHTFVCYKRDSEVTRDRGSCYKFHRVAETWEKALEICSAEGAYLAIINSDAESKILEELFNSNCKVDIHWFHRLGRVRWHTVHGGRLADTGYLKWKKHEPNNQQGGECCGSMYYKEELNDILVDCKRKLSFICEKDVESLSVRNTTSQVLRSLPEHY